MDGHVNYVQSRHQRVEPTADQFKLCVSDGQRTSAHLPFYVIIKAANDEVPEFAAGEVTVRQAGSGRFRLVQAGSHRGVCEQVEEGEERQLDLSLLQVMDLDVPQDELRFSLLQAPRHGSIVRYAADGLNSTRRPGAGPPGAGPPGAGRPEPVLDFTLQDLQNGRWAMRNER